MLDPGVFLECAWGEMMPVKGGHQSRSVLMERGRTAEEIIRRETEIE